MSHIIEETGHSVITASSLVGTEVVVKKCLHQQDPRTLVRWRDELEALRVVGAHENIAKVLESSAVDLTITLRREAGSSLDRYVDTKMRSTLTRNDCDTLLSHMASALAHIHSHGIVHDDVKPENIIWSNEHKHGVLIDFGAAFDLSKVNKDYFVLSGTPSYAPPEYLNMRKGPEGDIWALGVTMLFVLGFVPLPEHDYLLPGIFEDPAIFRGGVHFEQGRHLHEMEQWLQDVGEARADCSDTEPLVERMLDPDPDRRIISEELVRKTTIE